MFGRGAQALSGVFFDRGGSMFSPACFPPHYVRPMYVVRSQVARRSHSQCRQATWGVRMLSRQLLCRGFAAVMLALISVPATAQMRNGQPSDAAAVISAPALVPRP